MALRDMMNLLSEQWDDVQRRLNPEVGKPLIVAMRFFVMSPDDEGLMRGIAEQLDVVLPPDHPILAAIAIDDVRSYVPRVWAQVVEKLRHIVASSPW
jgi:hypothetical protein